MNICLCVTNFKNDLVEAISKTAVDVAGALSQKASLVLYLPGEITWPDQRNDLIETVSYAEAINYRSKVRVLRNIIALGHELRARPRSFDIAHFYVGNLLELALIRFLVPRVATHRVVTVWQPYLNFTESLSLLRLFGRRVTAIAHHYLFNSWFLVPLAALGLNYFDRLIVHTRYQRRQLPFISDNLIRVIENGVSPPAEGPAAVPNVPPRILYIGHATAVKGLDILLSALGQLRGRVAFNASLALSDFGDLEIERLVHANRLDELVLLKDHVDVANEMRCHDVLVVPHVTAVGTSCYPNIVLEAFSVGIPVIASATPVLRELIEDQVTGFLVPPCDPVILARTITNLLANPDECQAMRVRQREVYRKRFTLERYVGRYLDMYGEIVDRDR